MNAWTYPRWRPAWQAARMVTRKERIEAVVCGKALFEGRAALRLQAEFGIPFVVCTYAMEILVWLASAKTRRDLRAVLQGAERVVVINEKTKQALREFGVPDRKFVKIYPGVAETFFESPGDVNAFTMHYGLGAKRIIVSAARLVPRKGFDVLIEAFASALRFVPDLHLLIVGDGPERHRLARRVQDLRLTSAVTLAGELSSDDLRRALACAEFFALTPRDLAHGVEGFGIVFLEAAAQGKTAVASRTGGVPEAVLDGTTGILVPPSDVAATADALLRLLKDGDLRRRLAASAWARAEKEFHWNTRALLFQGMMHALLSERKISTTKPR